MAKVTLLAALLLCAPLIAARAEAQPSNLDEALVHFERGAEFYDEDNFRGALIEFKRAYELAPSYKILFNIGQVEMELKNYAGALAAYTRYLREGGPDIAQGRVEQVTLEIQRLKGRIGQLVIRTADGAEILIDDISVGHAPLPESVPVNAGRHQIVVNLPGSEPERRTVDIAGQQELTVVIGNDLTTSRPAAKATPSRSRAPSSMPMYVGWGVTGGLAITATVFGVITYSHTNRLSELRDTFPVSKSELDDEGAKQRTSAILADGFAAAALVAGGVSLYLTLTRERAKERTPRTTLLVAPTGAYVSGHF